MNPVLEHTNPSCVDTPQEVAPSAPPLLLAGDDDQESEDHIVRGID
ncbi:hypothetical protein ACGFT2_22215 [Streptomyces sp. NPDC048514]